jgi:hypothetical protein
MNITTFEELKKYPNKVAFTGSIALKLHGATHRKPNNINIIVQNKDNIYNILTKHKWIAEQYGQKKGQVRKHFEFTKGNSSLNVFVNGSNLAPRFNNTVMLNGVRVVRLENLLKQKQKTIQQYPSNEKTLKNIKTIKELLLSNPKYNYKIPPITVRHSSANSKTTPPTRSNVTPSPTRRPSRLNFTTPSPPKGRKLF